ATGPAVYIPRCVLLPKLDFAEKQRVFSEAMDVDAFCRQLVRPAFRSEYRLSSAPGLANRQTKVGTPNVTTTSPPDTSPARYFSSLIEAVPVVEHIGQLIRAFFSQEPKNERTCHHARTHQNPRTHRQGIRPNSRTPGTRANLHRAWHLLSYVGPTLLIQVIEDPSATTTDKGRLRPPGTR